MILLCSFKDTDRPQRNSNFIAQMMLSIPWRAVHHCSTIRVHPDQGLIIIHHHCPVSQHLPPEPCVRAFSGPAFCGEHICCSIHRDRRAVKKEGIIIRHFFRDPAIDSERLQIAVGPVCCPAGASFILSCRPLPFLRYIPG